MTLIISKRSNKITSNQAKRWS